MDQGKILMNLLMIEDVLKKVKFLIKIDVRDQVWLQTDERLRSKMKMKFFLFHK
jgi:hypothetical protein